jgi:hypothetical protein
LHADCGVVNCRLGKRASDAMLGCVSCLKWGCSCARCWRACIGLRGAQNGAPDRYAEGTEYGSKYEGERYGGRAVLGTEYGSKYEGERYGGRAVLGTEYGSKYGEYEGERYGGRAGSRWRDHRSDLY